MKKPAFTFVILLCALALIVLAQSVQGSREGKVTLEESDKDTIKTISKPYLEWSIVD